MSDRVLVMREGRQMAIFDRDDADQEAVMAAAMGQAPQPCARRRRGVSWLQRHFRPEQVRELSLLLLIVVAVLVFGSLIEGYYTSRTFNRVASSVAIITVVAVGQTLVVLTRNIDLSVGSIVGCAAYFTGTQLAANHGIPPLGAVGIAVALGAVMGSLNGVLVAWGRVPSIIVTLGTLAIYRGFLIDYSGAKTVTDRQPAALAGRPAAPASCSGIGGLDIRAHAWRSRSSS